MNKSELVPLGKGNVKTVQEKMAEIADRQNRFGIKNLPFRNKPTPPVHSELTYDRDPEES